MLLLPGPPGNFLSLALLALEASPASPLASLLFLSLAYYLTSCVLSGYQLTSRKLPRCLSLHIIKKDSTYLDAFLHYGILLLLNSLAF